ncbi:MAG TPA: glycosyltransferase [Acidimicrobiia bacterium]|nr:glycosyltransferase [Acidimicrobiia bacterium]
MARERPRVLVLIKGLGIGGAEKLISEGARLWDRDQFEYSVAYVLPWKDQLVGDLERLGIQVHMIGSRRGLTPRTLFRLRALIRDEGIDLVHAHLPTMGIVARLASPVPVVYTEHNMADSYRPLTRGANRLTYGRNRAAMAVSGAVAGSVSSWPGPAVTVIPNGVAVGVEPAAAEEARAELGVAAGTPLIAHVGNIRPGKGHDVLIEATTRLIASRPDVNVVSIGGEKYPGDLDRVTSKAKEAGLGESLRFLGRRPDALRFVAAADLFVNPSSVEGLPVAILEAMALGRPVVATAAGGVPGIVKDGETGILVEPEDPEALAEGMLRMLADPELARRLADAASELVAKEYGLEPMVRATEDVYRQVLGA